MDLVKDMLKSGKTVIGTGANIRSETDFLVNSGFDFLQFDTQHTPVEIKALGPQLANMRGGQAIPIVRVGDNHQDQIYYALDIGAKGIIVPMVNSKEEAAHMVKCCKYPLDGVRSSGGVRGEWGEYETYRDYMDAVNEQLLIIPMIETREALDDIEDILSVPGIDVLLVGPSDLSINLEVPLDYTSTTYQDALKKIAAACARVGVAPGMYFVPPGITPEQLIEMGFRYFTLPWAEWATEGIGIGLSGLDL